MSKNLDSLDMAYIDLGRPSIIVGFGSQRKGMPLGHKVFSEKRDMTPEFFRVVINDFLERGKFAVGVNNDNLCAKQSEEKPEINVNRNSVNLGNSQRLANVAFALDGLRQRIGYKKKSGGFSKSKDISSEFLNILCGAILEEGKKKFHFELDNENWVIWMEPKTSG